MGVEVEVEFDYDAELPDELTIRVGDIITDVVQMDGGWWEGNLRNRRGLFPDNFVRVISGEQKKAALCKEKDPMKKRCRVLFSYQPTHDDELELKLNDIIEYTGEVEDGWWKGTLNGKTGVFPSNFVQVITSPDEKSVADKNKKNKEKQQPLPPMISGYLKEEGNQKLGSNAPKLPPKPVKEQCIVQFPYTALNDDELTLEEGQIITVLSKDVEDKGWWKGELDGKVGVFPDNFIKLVSPEEIKPIRHNSKRYTDDDSSVRGGAGAVALSKIIRSMLVPPPPPQSQPLPSTQTPLTSTTIGVTAASTTKASVSGGASSPSSSIQHSLFSPQHNTSSSSQNSAASSKQATPPQLDLDSVQRRGEKLVHPTADRVKAPKRRPPSSVFEKSSLRIEEDSSLSSSGSYNEKNRRSFKIVQHVKEAIDLANGSNGVEKESSKVISKVKDEISKPKITSRTKEETSKASLNSKVKEETTSKSNIIPKVKEETALKNNITPVWKEETTSRSNIIPKVKEEPQQQQQHQKTSKLNVTHKAESSKANVIQNKAHNSKLKEEKVSNENIKPVVATSNENIKHVAATSNEPAKTEHAKTATSTDGEQTQQKDEKKPEWLEELSRKQANRKSGLFQPSKDKPHIPAKPSQIRDEVVRKSAAVLGKKEEKSNNNNSLESSPSKTSQQLSDFSFSSSEAEVIQKPDHVLPSKVEAENLEKLSLIERVRRLEKLLGEVQQTHSNALEKLRTELVKERNNRMKFEAELDILRQSPR